MSANVKFNYKNIPASMKNLHQWVAYKTFKKGDKTMKIMFDAHNGDYAKVNDKRTWSSYIDARMFMSKNKLDGLAFVLDEGITFIDIDHSVQDEKLSNFAIEVLKNIPNTYAEYSVSGNGIHIFGYGKLDEESYKRNDELGLEMYDTKRFCCMTGNVIDERFNLTDISNIVKPFNEHYMGKHTKKYVFKDQGFNSNEIIERIKNSESKEKFEMLFSGDYSAYESHSSADFALVGIIARYTSDPFVIDEIFRESGLYRDKWDERRGNSTYGMVTIANLLNTRCEFEIESELEV